MSTVGPANLEAAGGVSPRDRDYPSLPMLELRADSPGRRSIRWIVTACALMAAVIAFAAAAHATARPLRAITSTTPRSVRIVAVGDIACAPGFPVELGQCQQVATAQLARSLHPAAALMLGDLQYESAATREWAAFGASWGSLPFPLHPVAGNHEYQTPRAAGYYRHFGTRAGKARSGWYAFDLGAWRIYALNSNCSIVACSNGWMQQTWLREDLANHPRACVLAMWHHPRFSSGEHGNSPWMTPIWTTLQRAHADVVLQAHDHDYERFRRLLADGTPSQHGITSFVAGTGGRSRPLVKRRAAGSQTIVEKRFGVLALTLGDRSYAWRFEGIDGQTPDSGSARCS